MADPLAQGTGGAVRLEVDGTLLRVVGDLVAASVAGVLVAGRDAIRVLPGDAAVLDLSQVRKADSAGLALVVDWLRAARRRELDLAIRGVPAQLALIAQVSGLEALMGGEATGAA